MSQVQPVNSFKLQEDPDVVNRLEKDLEDKCFNACDNARIHALVAGVFSLDDLDSRLENDVDSKMAVGIGYLGVKPVTVRATPDGNNSAVMLDYRFMVLVGAPTDAVCSQRVSATALLTLLRQQILGTPIENSTRFQRHWEFIEEVPAISDSERTMLYYTQVWRIRLPALGN